MDWNKLQHKLFEMDPTDPKKDLAILAQQAKLSARPVSESIDYLNESVEVAEGSLPLSIDSVSDFAALAGIRIDEGKQKTGRAGQAKHSDPAPKKLPSGTTKNISRDKLVGDSIQEGPLDTIKQGFKQGASNYNSISALNPKTLGNNTPSPQKQAPTADQESPKKKIDPRRVARTFGVNDPAFISAVQKMNQPGEQNILPREAQALAKAFSNMMNMSPRELQRNMSILKTQVQGSDSANKKSESIKERLYRELRKKGL